MHDVALAYLRFDTVHGNFVDSLVDLLAYDLSTSQRIGRPIRTAIPSTGIVEGANTTCATFVDSDCDWLFWLDADIGFQPDVLDLLLVGADPVERPAVSALAFKYRRLDPDLCNGTLAEELPVILDWGQDPEGRTGFVCRESYPADQLTRCAATGMACVVIHRSVHEAIFDRYGPVWHEPIPAPDGGSMLGPDVSFWTRAAVVGKPLHVHTGAHTNHAKTTYVGHASYASRLAAVGRSPHEAALSAEPVPPTGIL